MSNLTDFPTVREAPFYVKLSNKRVTCSMCKMRYEIPSDVRYTERRPRKVDEELERSGGALVLD